MNPPVKILALALVVTTLAAHSSAAQDTGPKSELKSGPASGIPLPALQCYATDGPRKGQEFDLSETIGKSPAVLFFVRANTPELPSVFRNLDRLASEFTITGLKSQALLLSDERPIAEAQLKILNGSYQFARPVLLCLAGTKGPKSFALNSDAALTVVLTKDGVIARSLGLHNVGSDVLSVIRKALLKLVGDLPDDPVELEKLIAQSFPADRAALKKLAFAKELELIELRAEVNRLRAQVAVGGNGGPVKAGPHPKGMTDLNVANFTGQDVAELYHRYTGKRVLVSEEAAQTEISIIVPGRMTYAQATKIIEKKLVMEGLGLVPDDRDPNLLQLVVQKPGMIRKVIGGRKPARARRVPSPPPSK